MNEKSNTKKNVFGMTKEEFYKMLEEQERLSKESFEDKALEQFVKEPEKYNLYDKVISTTNLILLFFLFGIIFIVSVISGFKGTMKAYVVVPIAVFSMIGILILITNAKKR